MAGKSLGVLTLDLIAKVGGFVEGLDKAGRKSKTFTDGVTKQFNFATKAIATGIATSIAATAALVKSSINHADTLSKTADKLGTTTEELSKLRYAAELTGVGQNTLDMALQRMVRRLAEAADGTGEAVKAIDSLGLSAVGLARMSPAESFKDIADAISRVPDQAERVRLAFKFFDSEGVALVNTMALGRDGIENLGDELQRLGGVIDGKTAKQAEAFNDNLTRMRLVVTGTGNELAAALLPQLVEFTDIIKDAETQQAIKDIVQGMADIAINAVKIGAAAGGAARFLGESMAAWFGGAALGDLPRLEDELDSINRKIRDAKSVGTVRGGDTLEDLEREKARLEELIRLTNELAQSNFDRNEGTKPGSPATGAVGVQGDIQTRTAAELALEDAIDSRIAKYEEEIALHGKKSELARVQYEIESGALKGLSKEQEDQLLLLAQSADSLGYLDRMAGIESARQSMAESMEQQIALYGNASEAARVLYEIEHGALADIDPAQKAYLVNLAAEIDLKNQLAEEDKARAAAVEDQAKIVQELGLEAARNIQSTFADFLFDPFDKGLKGMAREFGNMIRRMAAEAASAAILKKMFGGMQGSNVGWISALGSAFAGAKDGGGMIGAGQWGIVGEIGPELVRGPAMVTSRAETGRMLGSNVEVIVNGNGTGVQHNVSQQFDGGRGVQRIIIDAVRAGGRNGELDDLFATFGATRARGSV